jgi:hypothetical protein
MSCETYQELVNQLLWLSAAQTVLFAFVGFLGLHWRGQLHKERQNRISKEVTNVIK